MISESDGFHIDPSIQFGHVRLCVQPGDEREGQNPSRSFNHSCDTYAH